MKYLKLPEDLQKELEDALTFEQALDRMFKRFLEEMGGNRILISQAWAKVKDEMIRRGMTVPENFSYDFIRREVKIPETEEEIKKMS